MKTFYAGAVLSGDGKHRPVLEVQEAEGGPIRRIWLGPQTFHDPAHAVGKAAQMFETEYRGGYPEAALVRGHHSQTAAPEKVQTDLDRWLARAATAFWYEIIRRYSRPETANDPTHQEEIVLRWPVTDAVAMTTRNPPDMVVRLTFDAAGTLICKTVELPDRRTEK